MALGVGDPLRARQPRVRRLASCSGPRSPRASSAARAPWAAILAAGGVGAVVGGRRRDPDPAHAAAGRRASSPRCLLSLQTLALALGAPTWVIAAAAFVGGAGLAVHLTLWFTVFQQQVPEHAQSRVSSYDTLGSFVLMPLGMALVGPLADAIGIVETLWLALVVMWASWAAILAAPVGLGDPRGRTRRRRRAPA